MERLSKATGWVILMAASGPNPSENGSIYMQKWVIYFNGIEVDTEPILVTISDREHWLEMISPMHT